jgi:hypothetical protein
MGIQQDIAAFLPRRGYQPFCAKCLANAVKARNVPPVERAMNDLGKDHRGYRVEEGDCSSCSRTTLTIRALWKGM